MASWFLASNFVLLSLSAAVLLCLGVGGGGGGGGGVSATSINSLPPPLPMVNFTIGVEGVVWCKSCRYPGYFADMDASPLPGAKVYLRCKRGRRAVTVAAGESGPGGYFLIQTSRQVSAFTSRQCRVYVPRSPVQACGVPDYPAAGRSNDDKQGLPLKFHDFVKRDNGLQGVYSVGNRLFRPKNPRRCY